MGGGPGATLVDFCLANQVTAGQVYGYKRRFMNHQSSAGLPAMVPVQVVESHEASDRRVSGGAVEVAVGTGAVMRFEVETDVKYATELIAGVSRRLGC